jgi:hypothetical protein
VNRYRDQRMRTGQRYVHKAAFARGLSGTQTGDNLRAWVEEVRKVADVEITRTNRTDTHTEYTAIGKWK